MKKQKDDTFGAFKFEGRDVAFHMLREMGLSSKFKKSFTYVANHFPTNTIAPDLEKLEWYKGKNYHWLKLVDGNLTLLFRHYGNHFTIYFKNRMEMSKYGEAIGLWELRVGGFTKDLKPQKGDNLKLMRLMTESKKRNDESWMMEQIGSFVKELIARDCPPLNDAERQELDMYVEYNILQLMQELLIAFRWSTKEQMEKLAGEDVKKAMLQATKS
mgnify:CR=1 FL=1